MTSIIMGLVYSFLAVVLTMSFRDIADNYRTEQIAQAGRRLVYELDQGKVTSPIHSAGSTMMQVVNEKGQVVAASPALMGKPRIAAFEPAAGDVRAIRRECHSKVAPSECLIIVTYRVFRSGGDWLVYAADFEAHPFIDPVYILVLAGCGLVLVGVTAAATSRSVASALNPVHAIRTELAEITGTDLGRRVPVPDHDDEIAALARTANETLDRLHAAVEQQRRFASDASHDLRTPITAMRTQIEESLLHPDETDWRETASALLESLNRIQAIVTDLLVLARLDAGIVGRTEHVDLAELVRMELAGIPALRVRVETDLEAGVVVMGERIRLTRLLMNLLTNAERHASTVITIKVSSMDAAAVLEVIDDGAGLAPEDREVVFQRFARLDSSRSRDAGGTGLGLPIARQIAETHGGTLVVGDSDRGARFVLTLPRAEP
ncbi:sensor histidine kinase [Rhizohabitans arisaemae]|uniref:sensor histidine kinase n=1 Tax=Rhizohabitans arisaemae TaxID=2720610 RepID=UPI0024B0C73C|nr:HAMP domain-containing sensor histidine kinase [Rhizohabitans arisaemae]